MCSRHSAGRCASRPRQRLRPPRPPPAVSLTGDDTRIEARHVSRQRLRGIALGIDGDEIDLEVSWRQLRQGHRQFRQGGRADVGALGEAEKQAVGFATEVVGIDDTAIRAARRK